MADQEKPKTVTVKHPNGTSHKVVEGSAAHEQLKRAKAAAKAEE